MRDVPAFAQLLARMLIVARLSRAQF